MFERVRIYEMPYCDNDMEQGLLQGMRRVAWVKNQHKISLLPKQGEIMIENNTVTQPFIMKVIIPMCISWSTLPRTMTDFSLSLLLKPCVPNWHMISSVRTSLTFMNIRTKPAASSSRALPG
ncbi:PF20097 family protein [Anaeromonas gelatinilytica]|uniref:PF20097 family protein n=1 Tax=Anaeromonas gelatinilytica TaxID=2683194 RepID=UPI003314821F